MASSRYRSLAYLAKSGVMVVSLGATSFVGLNLARGSEKFYENRVMPFVHRYMDPETSHYLALRAAGLGMPWFGQNHKEFPQLKTKVFGFEFDNPVGLAAGFDKSATAVIGLASSGFGFVEIGSITPLPQSGNPKPRVFRLLEDQAVVNRYGFNSDGFEVVKQRLHAFRARKTKSPVLLGVNIGANKESVDRVGDYAKGIEQLGEYGDYLVVNVSSPNTPNLRALQRNAELRTILEAVKEKREKLPLEARPVLLLKVAPDLSASEKADIARICCDKSLGVDGLIVSNTTIARSAPLISSLKDEVGGLSGKPLRDLSTSTIRDFYRLTKGELPIVGCGGIFSGADAYEKIRAGASLIQLYTAMVFLGPPVLGKVKRELAELLARDGFKCVADAVGADVKNVISPKAVVEEPVKVVEKKDEKAESPKAEPILQISVLLLKLPESLVLYEAEVCQVKRKTLNGDLKRFKRRNLNDFVATTAVDDKTEPVTGPSSIGALFSSAERHWLLQHYLENLRVNQEDVDFASQYGELKLLAQAIPGENLCKFAGTIFIDHIACEVLICDESVFATDLSDFTTTVAFLLKSGEKLKQLQVVKDLFPLHSQDELCRLEKVWCSRLDFKQPYAQIRDYFGEKIGIYFAFLGFYTKALVCPSAVAALYWLVPWNAVSKEAMFALFNLIWVTVFLELWKRRSNMLAYGWGMLGYQPYKPARPEFKGPIKRSIVTDKPEPHYPSYKRLLKMYTITYPIVALCLLGAVLIMLLYYHLQLIVEKHYKRFGIVFGHAVLYSPTSTYALVIVLLSKQYRRLARHLNELENHRLSSSYENHLIAKLILVSCLFLAQFDFVNNFGCLFYVAFVLAETNRLFSYLACVLITQQIVQQFQESLLPYLLLKARRSPSNLAKITPLTEVNSASDDGELINLIQQQLVMDSYEDVFDDYQELWLQFGYAFLFSSIFPLAAVFALLNNIIEIRSDAFKLCNAFRRPFGVPVATIGAWQTAFEVLGVIAVITNTALLATSAQSQGYLKDWTTSSIILLFVAFEHLVLFAKFAIMVGIPDMPEHVKRQIERQEYLARENQLEKENESCARIVKVRKSQTVDSLLT